jgi:Tetratricopeptide repeat
MRRVLGDDHLLTLRLVYCYAVTLRMLRQYEQARELAEDTLTRCRRVLGDDHPDTVTSADRFTSSASRCAGDRQAEGVT